MSTDLIRALISGCPQRLWKRKPLVMLQAFVDDSKASSGEQRLYLAAYVHDAETWIDFTSAWDEALQAHPRLDYFKMSEAHSRHDQFRKFSEGERNRKVSELANVIKRFSPWGIHVSVSVPAFNERVKPFAPFPMSTPYYLLFFSVVFGIARIHSAMGMNEPCEFVFDQQEELSNKVLPAFNAMFDAAPDGWRSLVSGTPVFRDDKKFLPLQAADMLAWHVRRNEEGNYPKEYLGIIDRITLADVHRYTEISNESLDIIGAGFRDIPDVDLIDKKHWNRLLSAFDGAVPSQHSSLSWPAA